MLNPNKQQNGKKNFKNKKALHVKNHHRNHPMSKFQIFKSDGKPEIIEADWFEHKKTKRGLDVKFFIGKKVKIKYSNVMMVIPVPLEAVSFKPLEIQDGD